MVPQTSLSGKTRSAGFLSGTGFPEKALRLVIVLFAAVLLLPAVVTLRASAQTPTAIVLRPGPPKQKKAGDHTSSHVVISTPLKKEDVGEIKVGGKPVTITGWGPVLGGDYGLQLVVLLDSQEQIGINEQFDDIRKLFNHLPDNVEIAVGYLLQGKTRITQGFTKDRKVAGDALKEPQDTASPKNENGDPYSCLRDLAAHWPQPDPKKLRAVLVITDGIVRANSFQSGDQQDPDVVGTADNLVRAGIMPFPFFYLDPVVPQGRSEGGQLEGQNNMDVLASTTGGFALYEGQFAPGSFDALLEKMFTVLQSMTVATIDAKGSGFKQIDVKPANENSGIIAPDGVTLGNVLKSK